jgi:outer membrane protein assembly factor BamE (lipoprotein component of BamABCDE complex)
MWYRAILITRVIFMTCPLAGCLIIPTNYYTDYSRKNVAEESPADIVTGVTTREEVLIILGEPDKVSEDEVEVWYMSSKVKSIVAMYGGGGGEMVRDYIHVIRFDRNGLVKTMRLDINSDHIRDPTFQLYNERGLREPSFLYNPEPHFSKTPIIYPEKAK